ncbi:MAG: biopolymer transporter ExbD [Acidobacteriia bacterium]|nr:biopolymer transporter ExbD [Terriglobia bacterium]
MAFSLGNDSGIGRRRFGGSNGTLSEINIVPLVDVVLVLLIIFMLTAHVMEFGLEIEVPKTTETRETAEDLPIVNISKTGAISLNEKKVNINEIPMLIKRDFKNAKKVYVRADKAGLVDPFVQVIAALGKAGITPQIVTQPLK